MSNTYAINIDQDVPGEARLSLVERFKSDGRIESWWNHMPGLYLVMSDCDAGALAKLVEGAVKPWSFLVARVDLEDLQGWMPDRAWGWIQRRALDSQKQAAESALPEAVG